MSELLSATRSFLRLRVFDFLTSERNQRLHVTLILTDIFVKANSQRKLNLKGKFGGGEPTKFRIKDVF